MLTVTICILYNEDEKTEEVDAMTKVTEWMIQEAEATYNQMKRVEALVKDLRTQYKGWKYVNSAEYQNIPAYFRNMLNTGETYQKERIDKDVKAHFEKLQMKVNERIGEIKEIEDLGGNDYYFKGNKGNVGVRVIFAGGWNIQRLHTRWIFDRKA